MSGYWKDVSIKARNDEEKIDKSYINGEFLHFIQDGFHIQEHIHKSETTTFIPPATADIGDIEEFIDYHLATYVKRVRDEDFHNKWNSLKEMMNKKEGVY